MADRKQTLQGGHGLPDPGASPPAPLPPTTADGRVSGVVATEAPPADASEGSGAERELFLAPLNQGFGVVPSPELAAPPTLPKPGRAKRAWTALTGRPLETAPADDLERAGFGVRPPRKGTQEANALHIAELRRKLRRQRFMRALPAVIALVLFGVIVSYLLATRP